MSFVKISKVQIKSIRALTQKKFREEQQLFVVEGDKMVHEAIELVPEQIEAIYATEDFLINLTTDLPCYVCSSKELMQLSNLKSPNKALLVLKQNKNRGLLKTRSIVLDGVQDPGNLGTIMRLADWFGISQIICSEDTVDCYNPKVIQATMGAVFRVNVHYTDLTVFLKNTQQKIYGALLEGVNYREVTYEKDALLLMGNEGKGIRSEILPFIQEAVTIPKLGVAESLNVSTATAILLAEMVFSIPANS
jgi:RNA methyltransferase, TrmH family